MAWTTNLHAHAFRISALGIAFGFAAFGFAGGASAAAPKLKPLHGFCKKTGCPDGLNPYLGPAVDSSGDLYGTSLTGGLPNNAGVVYQLHPKGNKYKFKLLYTFCPTTPCTDGEEPLNQPIVDTAGNLYGTTAGGGAFNLGTVYELVRGLDPKTKATTWTHVTLYDFCPAGAQPCIDGTSPEGRLAYPGSLTGARYDGKSPFYGTAAGGNGNGGAGEGVIFRSSPATARRRSR